jgi:hypothetical protein
MKIGISI